MFATHDRGFYTCGLPMRVSFALLAALLAAAPSAADAAERVRLHGSNTIGEKLAPAIAEAWLATKGCGAVTRSELAPGEFVLAGAVCGIEVEFATHGSSTGFGDLISGKADVAMASRPASPAEIERAAALGKLDMAPQEAVLALDGVAVIVHPDNPLRSLRVEQIRALFDGSVSNWSALGGGSGPVRVHARDDASGTFETFRMLVLGTQSLRGDAERYESTSALAAAVAADRNAIGFVGFAGVGKARALAVADAGVAMAPQAMRIAVEDYALSRRLFLYRPQDATPAARALVDFALSPAGQAVVERIGYVSQDVRAFADAVRSDAPADYRTLVQGAERLSLNFRFNRNGQLLDSKTGHDVARLVGFMQRPENRDRRLLLLGFADPDETSAYLELALSNDRVDYIGGLLEREGQAVHVLRGMGGSAPLASDTGALGRLRNRRVEVWVGPPGSARPDAVAVGAAAARAVAPSGAP